MYGDKVCAWLYGLHSMPDALLAFLSSWDEGIWGESGDGLGDLVEVVLIFGADDEDDVVDGWALIEGFPGPGDDGVVVDGEEEFVDMGSHTATHTGSNNDGGVHEGGLEWILLGWAPVEEFELDLFAPIEFVDEGFESEVEGSFGEFHIFAIPPDGFEGRGAIGDEEFGVLLIVADAAGRSGVAESGGDELDAGVGQA
jgi:hypothetical protein